METTQKLSIEELKNLISKTDKYPNLSKLWNKVTIPAFWSSIKFLDEELTKKDIENFYQENKKIIFKKWDKQKEELENNWSEEKFIKLIECIIIYSQNNNNDFDSNLSKLNEIFNNLKWSNIIEFIPDNDINYSIACNKLDNEIKKIESDFKNLSRKEFFYKYIIPKAVLNNDKWHYYSSDELKYIADLRFNNSDIPLIMQELNNVEQKNFKVCSMEDFRIINKKQIEYIFIIIYLLNIKLPTELEEKIEEHYKGMKDIEYNLWIDKEYWSSLRVMYSMATWKDDMKIDYEAPMAKFYFTKYINDCVKFLWQIIWDKELNKIK